MPTEEREEELFITENVCFDRIVVSSSRLFVISRRFSTVFMAFLEYFITFISLSSPVYEFALFREYTVSPLLSESQVSGNTVITAFSAFLPSNF